MPSEPPLKTADSRYIVIRGRLWRASNPNLSDARRQELVDELMDARRAVREANRDEQSLKNARRRVHAVKVALGERGPVWWDDGALDLNRHLVVNTDYRNWYLGLKST
jgi:hypothetical protein